MSRDLIDCAQNALHQVGQKLFISFVKLTKYYPRRLPQSEAELEKLKETLKLVWKLPDDPYIWHTFASQLTAGKPTSMRRSYGHIVNACFKLTVARLAMQEKQKQVKVERKNQGLDEWAENNEPQVVS